MKSNHPIILRSAVAVSNSDTTKHGARSGSLRSTLRKVQSILERWIIPGTVATFLANGTALAADVTSTWNVADGDWGAPINWTPNELPFRVSSAHCQCRHGYHQQERRCNDDADRRLLQQQRHGSMWIAGHSRLPIL